MPKSMEEREVRIDFTDALEQNRLSLTLARFFPPRDIFKIDFTKIYKKYQFTYNVSRVSGKTKLIDINFDDKIDFSGFALYLDLNLDEFPIRKDIILELKKKNSGPIRIVGIARKQSMEDLEYIQCKALNMAFSLPVINGYSGHAVLKSLVLKNISTFIATNSSHDSIMSAKRQFETIIYTNRQKILRPFSFDRDPLIFNYETTDMEYEFNATRFTNYLGILITSKNMPEDEYDSNKISYIVRKSEFGIYTLEKILQDALFIKVESCYEDNGAKYF